MDSFQHVQAMGQSPFFYYNPDPKPDNRQHGHFSQLPSSMPIPLYHHQVQTLPSTPIYSRPNSSCSQPPMQPMMYNAALMNMTPMASPRPIYHKPTILIQDHSPRLMLDCSTQEPDLYFNPSTPPMSASGSVTSSPSSCDLVPTPVNINCYGLGGFEGVKEGCEGEVQSENLAGGEWARCGSPPMTPVFIHPTSLMSNSTSELLSGNSCPSLSPSPSPYPRSVISDQDIDFCDPRNLTVPSAPSAVQASSIKSVTEFPALPTLCAGDDEAHRFMLGGEAVSKVPVTAVATFDFTAAAHHDVLPAFDQFSDLDSEVDFVNGLVNFPPTENVQFFGSKRQRTISDLTTLDTEPFISEDDFEDFDDLEDSEQFAVACLPSPPASGSEAENRKAKRSRKSRRSQGEEDSSEFDELVRSRKYTVPMNAAAGSPAHESTGYGEHHNAPSQSGSDSNNVSNMGGSEAGATPVQPAPVNRRGRKQSLTEDPSKTFVCDQCNRRFRRQEHLKRHYRSLHTHDKPFECHECGKKFSRSDNLSQHARTHGSGAIVMGVLEEGELVPDHMESASDGEHIHSLGKVLFNVAAAASGSESEATSELGSSDADSQSRRKRKRSE